MSPERDFVRYRDHGDLAALAAVFDVLAPDLLLVAGHLVRDGALAEDLVQTTFVEAMRSAGRYDARRPLLPWLAQILTHHARKLRRQRSRPDDPRPRQCPVQGSAAEQVLDAEVTRAVEHALGELPPRYRQVLTLRLVHDLPLTAIAHALGCPPETVKTRLRRGLERLRHHLPRGITSAVAVLLATGRGLAAVRADVLAHGRHAASAAARVGICTAFPIGVMLMNHVLLRAGVVALVLLFGWAAVAVWWSAPAGPRASAVGAAPAVAAVGADPAADAAIARTEAVPVHAAEPAVVFHGRCVDASTGGPLPSVRAAAWWLDRASTKLANEYEAGEAAADVRTDADGRFRLHCALVAGAKVSVRVGGEHLLLRIGAFGPFERPQEVDLGELRMHTGVRLSTRVVDQRGRPVGGVAVTVSRKAWSQVVHGDLLGERFGYSVRSAADGTIAWPGAFAPGRYEVWWFEDSIPPERSRSPLLVPPDLASLAHDLVWPVEDERQSIRGRVVDDRGRPVPGLYLSGEGGGTRGHARSGQDGRFVMPRIGPYDERLLRPVTLTIRSVLDGYELVDALSCEWGREDVQLLVRAAQRLVVRAIDPRTGENVADATVLCAAVGEGDDAPSAVEPRKTVLADGAAQLAIARQTHLLQVLPADPALAPSALLRWEPGMGDEITCDLAATKVVEVCVATADGAGVRGSEVWTARPIEGDPVASAAALEDVRMPLAFAFGLDPATRWQRYGVDDAPIDHGTTDATGRVRLRVPATGAVLLAAFGPGHVPRAVVAAGTQDRVDIVVQRGAAIRFELSPPDLVRQLAHSDSDRLRGVQRLTLAATRTRDEQDPKNRQPTASRAVTGASCTCDGLLPGTYGLIAYGHLPSELGDILLHESLGTATLRDGEARVVPIDLGRWVKGRVRAQVRVNGDAWTFAACSLEALGSDGSPRGSSVEVTTDADGRFEADMVPGPFRFHLRSLFDHGTYWCATERFDVVAGQAIDVVFDVRRVVARVRVVTPGDQPAASLRVVMRCDDEPRDARCWTTDADGWLTIDPAPLSAFRLMVESPGRVDGRVGTEALREALLGPVQVPPRGTAVEFCLQLRGAR